MADSDSYHPSPAPAAPGLSTSELTLEAHVHRAFARYQHDGSQSSLDLVARWTRGRLCAIAVRITGDESLAEDAVQVAYLEAFRRAERFDNSRRILPWLVGVVQNTARAAAREQHRFRSIESTCRHPTTDGGASKIAEAEDLREALRAHLVRLPWELRAVVLARYYDGLTDVQVAARLGIPLGTVKSRMSRALRQLRWTMRHFSEGAD